MKTLLQLFGFRSRDYKYILVSRFKEDNRWAKDDYHIAYVFETKQETLKFISGKIARDNKEDWDLYKKEV